MHRYVQEVAPGCLWVALSPSLRGRVHALDNASTLEQLRAFSRRYSSGQALRCTVARVRGREAHTPRRRACSRRLLLPARTVHQCVGEECAA